MGARDLYRRFAGMRPRKLLSTSITYAGKLLTRRARLNISIPAELAVIGRVSALEYDTIFDGQLKKARHTFAPGARPLLAVGTRRGQVFLIGHHFGFTNRGFVDFDTHDRAIEYHEKTGKVTILR
jgi:hypothetical protein